MGKVGQHALPVLRLQGTGQLGIVDTASRYRLSDRCQDALHLRMAMNVRVNGVRVQREGDQIVALCQPMFFLRIDNVLV